MGYLNDCGDLKSVMPFITQQSLWKINLYLWKDKDFCCTGIYQTPSVDKSHLQSVN